jgi:hypothetical protein
LRGYFSFILEVRQYGGSMEALSYPPPPRKKTRDRYPPVFLHPQKQSASIQSNLRNLKKIGQIRFFFGGGGGGADLSKNFLLQV